MHTKALSVAAALGAAALTLTACGAGGAGGSGTSLKLALNQTEEHPSYIALDHFGDRLGESTGDRWDVDVYANETLGAQDETLQLVSDGSVDMSIVSGTQLEALNKDFVALNLPTSFDSIEHQMQVIQDEAVVGDLYSSLEGQNITVLGGFTQGTRNFYSTRGPVETPADLKGQKIRVQESEVHIAMVKALGGSPTPLSYGEVYTALQSGVLDGAENNEVSYFTQKHHEVAKDFSTSEHLVGIDFLIINTDKLDAMSEEDRAAFDQEWAAAMQEHTDLWADATEKAIADAEADGATFHEADTAAFDEALAPLEDQFLETESSRALFDSLQK
jgi:tripartite ATP-independent transporter DctP family solute receptor